MLSNRQRKLKENYYQTPAKWEHFMTPRKSLLFENRAHIKESTESILGLNCLNHLLLFVF